MTPIDSAFYVLLGFLGIVIFVVGLGLIIAVFEYVREEFFPYFWWVFLFLAVWGVVSAMLYYGQPGGTP